MLNLTVAVAIWFGTVRYSSVHFGTVRYSSVQFGTVQDSEES